MKTRKNRGAAGKTSEASKHLHTESGFVRTPKSTLVAARVAETSAANLLTALICCMVGDILPTLVPTKIIFVS